MEGDRGGSQGMRIDGFDEDRGERDTESAQGNPQPGAGEVRWAGWYRYIQETKLGFSLLNPRSGFPTD